jgi:hypothetical protein
MSIHHFDDLHLSPRRRVVVVLGFVFNSEHDSASLNTPRANFYHRVDLCMLSVSLGLHARLLTIIIPMALSNSAASREEEILLHIGKLTHSLDDSSLFFVYNKRCNIRLQRLG